MALTHVRVIDGTGAAAREDQTVIVDHGKIAAVGPAASTPTPAGAQVMDLAGHTVIPGLVGMHEHLFYPVGGGVPMYPEMAYSFPRLYLASGVTTARKAVPWTSPEDIPYDPNLPIPPLGGSLPGGFQVAFADATTRWIPESVPEKTLRLLITANDGQPIPPLP